MAQSAQAKEVILEIGEETGTVVHTTQEQSGEVEKITFETPTLI